MNICPNLPPLNTLEQNNNDHTLFTNTSYEIYKNNFYDNTVTFNGYPIKTNTELKTPPRLRWGFCVLLVNFTLPR